MNRLPVVAVVGRPNVGKSTLVNRIVGGRPAVTEEMPGVTRDRREFKADWAGREFVLVDTGGWELTPGEPLSSSIRAQAEAAIHAADAVIFVVDATTGVSDDDEGVVRLLRSADVPVILAANKVDEAGRHPMLDDLWSLGLGTPHGVSAFHGRGVGDLLDEVVGLLPDEGDLTAGEDLPAIAIIGRPNVGKSTLLNRLVGEDRVIVSDRPGTTRDPIDAVATVDGHRYRITDTAGIRRKPQITEDSDFYAVLRARKALEESDAALLIIDALDGVTHQDQRIAAEVVEAGVSLVILLNKWDAIDEEQRELTERSIADRLGFVSWAPVLRMSALTGARTHRIGAAIEVVLENRMSRIGTGQLNKLVRAWTGSHPPPVRKGRRAKLQYAVQAAAAPPTFIVFVSGGELGDDYLRVIENRIREELELTGTPVKILVRTKARTE
ncbi:MAG TPA: ribosome biogenesis GTPase Der [Acidimicrobiia bacterium]|nr:ribosome biogenesis GTPase Der [Acidimicrobiia bacterium]